MFLIARDDKNRISGAFMTRYYYDYIFYNIIPRGGGFYPYKLRNDFNKT